MVVPVEDMDELDTSLLLDDPTVRHTHFTPGIYVCMSIVMLYSYALAYDNTMR